MKYITTYCEAKSKRDSVMLDSVQLILEEIDCPDSIKQIWKKTLLGFVEVLKGKELTEPKLSALRSTATLCADQYGDAVHWARAILSRIEYVEYSSYDNCSSNSLPRAKIKPSNTLITSSQLMIYPSPSGGEFDIVIPTGWKESNIEIFDLQGRLIWSQSNTASSLIHIDIEISDGTYILKALSDSGDSKIMKFVVIN